MKEVSDKLDAVVAEHTNFHLREMVVERQSRVVDSLRETTSALNETYDIYGRDQEKDKIVNILVNHVSISQQVSTLPIIGIGGLGKTTLGQLVFNDPRVTKHFDTRLWVCVSENFDVKTLIKAMIESLTGSGSASSLMHLDTLQCRLWELLRQKKYLLVLDDVWNDDQEKWAILKNILACGSIGASIVVTTRLKKVADIMGTLPSLNLSGLSKEHCWLLFRQRAFGQEIENHPKLEAIGRQIVKKCAGVPLAAKALGGLLRFKREEKEWLYVKESEIWKLLPEESLILPALRLSYQHLPLVLRRCFAYCSVFPKDSVIEKEEVILLWMAHGYISSNGIKEVEDVGNEVWNELVLRSLFQDVETNEGNTSFKMHDLVHDLAQSIMENKVPGVQVEIPNIRVTNNKIRQVNLRRHSVAFPTSIQLGMDIPFILLNFNRLRMLDASWAGLEDLPHALSNLKHLRSLNLSGNYFRTLPNAICRLWNLKILILNHCKILVGLPKPIRYMNNLRHIFLEGCTSLVQMPSKIGDLTFLKTLSMFIVGEERGNQLDELKCLNLGGKLEIKHLERLRSHMDAKKANLGEKSNVRYLVLQWEADNATQTRESMDENILEALEPHPNLEKLVIRGFRGRHFGFWKRFSCMVNLTGIVMNDLPNCLHLPPLEELPQLQFLGLTNLAVEYIMEDGVPGGNPIKARFPSLGKLHLDALPNLKGLLKEEVGELFPNLRVLAIKECSSLILPSLPSVKELNAFNCSCLTMTSFSKLHNITSLMVDIDKNMACIPNETLENLSNLESFEIWNAHEHSLPLDWFRNLKSLAVFVIQGSETLMCLPERWLRHITTLQRVTINDCLELVELSEGIRLLNSLTSLRLRYLPKMVRLPEVLQHVSSLKSLSIENLPQLTSLPDWLCNILSLAYLAIGKCPRVESVPSSIKGTTNMRQLSIWGCPELQRRCEKGKGEDWDKIAHIPNLSIGYED